MAEEQTNSNSNGYDAGGVSFLEVPGTIKQETLPYNKSNQIIQQAITAGELGIENAVYGENTIIDYKEIKQQTNKSFFSYNNNSYRNLVNASFGFVNMNILPNSFKNFFLDGDISYKLLFRSQFRNSENEKNIDFNNFLDTIPCIQIREYQQNSKLSIISDIFKNLYEGFQSAKDDANKSVGEIMKQFYEKLKKFFTNGIANELIKNVWDDTREKATFPKYLKEIAANKDYKTFLVDMPYAFYYLMISSTTTNFYELPYSGNYVLQSDSSQGWQSRGLQNVTVNNENMLGKVMNYFTKNLSFNMTPTWDGNSSSSPISFDVEFQLFNDTLEAACNNFKFIHTFIPGNNWFQYHVYSCPPNVFDIRIKGINRFFMCTAKIDCTKLGVMRQAPSEFYKVMGIDLNEEFNTEIKIPDAYNVKITFTSLLPNNFNNYLYAMYSRDENIFIANNTKLLYKTFMDNLDHHLDLFRKDPDGYKINAIFEK